MPILNVSWIMLDINNVGYYVLSSYGMQHCNEFITDVQPITYFDDNLNYSSFIDHMWHVCIWLLSFTYSWCWNLWFWYLSDHRPLVYTLRLTLTTMLTRSTRIVYLLKYSWRWYKSDLNTCYEQIYCELQSVDIHGYATVKMTVDWPNTDTLLSSIIVILCVLFSEPPVLHLVDYWNVKPYWNELLDKLKEDSVFWHRLWVHAGRPSYGTVQQL